MADRVNVYEAIVFSFAASAFYLGLLLIFVWWLGKDRR